MYKRFSITVIISFFYLGSLQASEGDQHKPLKEKAGNPGQEQVINEKEDYKPKVVCSNEKKKCSLKGVIFEKSKLPFLFTD